MLAVSIGCPSGVGPEVAVAAAEEASDLLLVGDFDVVVRAAQIVGVDRPIHRVDERAVSSRARLIRATRGDAIYVYQPTESLSTKDMVFGKPSAKGGAAQLAWVDAACDLARDEIALAMVTGPVSKEAVVRGGGRGFIGHTEHLAARCGLRDKAGVTMAFWTEPFTSALVTTHLRLAAVPRAVTRPRVRATLVHLTHFLRLLSRGKRVKVVVAGLNPHASENGQFGDEEAKAIVPAMKDAARAFGKSLELLGPLPVEHAFRLAQAKKVDGVVAPYHDQATLAMKLLSFGEAVNVTLGLPIVRTSVDHGTAYDIAGTGKADASGMREAIELARRLV
jgi:4-hydroxythreonine-4-phosphate dehydrogenase